MLTSVVTATTFSEAETPEETRAIGRISDIWVDPDRRGLGIGRALISTAEARLRGAGLKRIEISAVPANEAALRLYRRLGYGPALVTLAKSP